ncbi:MULTISPECIES: NfeD family protein [unclassified Luteimonas]|uniref:NfeD family protein n=1 Tax=unclassified Luteimonas TaxID=2629088 RepID=UPI001602880C|nr:MULTISPECIES: NfeD family protein [unclassified Luteimonas]MBB1472795.1 NfeD family protein [Luteimonas sp. MC1782]MBB6598501.1 NfeD family protein [Luteimonas sp. MC1825]QOC88692.1 NfeD family protein [Luteimonas sp. MC1825]
MRWGADTTVWAAIALVLIAAETFMPGAFLLWMGIAAALVWLVVLLVPGLSMLAQVILFVVLSVVAVLAYRKWFRRRERPSDRPLLNRRADQLVGRVVPLDHAIVGGRGRVKIDDAYWVVRGVELPAGTLVRVVGSDGMVLEVLLAE